MRFLLAALILMAVCGCEKKLSQKELEAQKAAQATPKPAATPSNWMWKEYKNPLEKKAAP